VKTSANPDGTRERIDAAVDPDYRDRDRHIAHVLGIVTQARKRSNWRESQRYRRGAARR
jgi:hypothetical protein